MVEVTPIVIVCALALCALIVFAAWRVLRVDADPELERDTDPPSDPEAPEAQSLPRGFRVLETRSVGPWRLTLTRTVRVDGVFAKGWERVIFVEGPGGTRARLRAPHATRIGAALSEWGSNAEP